MCVRPAFYCSASTAEHEEPFKLVYVHVGVRVGLGVGAAVQGSRAVVSRAYSNVWAVHFWLIVQVDASLHTYIEGA